MATLRSRLNQTQSSASQMPSRDFEEDDDYENNQEQYYQPRQEQNKATTNREQSRIDAYLKR